MRKGGWEEQNWREREEKGESCWGRCKASAYKVAIRGKVALCEARGTSVPITQHTKDWVGGVGCTGKRPRSPTWAGPHQTPQAELHGPIWGFQHYSSLAFEKARQEFTLWATHGLEQESDLRAWRSWKPPPPPAPCLKHLSGRGLLNGTCRTVISELLQFKIMDGWATVWEKIYTGDGRETPSIPFLTSALYMFSRNCVLWENAVLSEVFETCMIRSYAFPSACQNCILSVSSDDHALQRETQRP